MTPHAALDQGLAELGLCLPEGARTRLMNYAALLEKWNRTYNLTAVRDPLKIVTHHLLDSLCVVPHLPAGTLADVGSGGGLPGVPIAIAEPARQVEVNDANAKKAAFLKQAKIELALDNLAVHEGRVEHWRPAPGFDGVITRGFAELADFVASCRHLLARGGLLLAMKGVYPREELARLPADVDASDVVALRVPQLRAERHLVRMRLRAA
jgi:16S rRNA (guanine527-N7)-methyltransferase